jgi:hypothetical protein
MSENGLLEPSFADAMTAIEQVKELPASKRTHWCCSLRMIAKALDRPPESIAARWAQSSMTTLLPPRQRWSRFLRQPGKVDSPMQRTNHHEDAKTIFGWVQSQGGA